MPIVIFAVKAIAHICFVAGLLAVGKLICSAAAEIGAKAIAKIARWI